MNMETTIQAAATGVELTLADAGTPKPSARLLVVEDAQCIHQIIGRYLGKMGLKADMAGDGKMACQMAEESKADDAPYDLILMDMQMPKMNGQDATRWLREHGWTSPIVAVSAFNGELERAEFLKVGGDECLSKPITEEKLRGVCTRYLNQ
jgi:CheY-like chemotaxis protein